MKYVILPVLLLAALAAGQWSDSLCVIQCGPDTFVARVPASFPYPYLHDSASNQLIFTQGGEYEGKTYMLDCATDSVVDSADVYFSNPAAFDATDRKVYGFSTSYYADLVVADLDARTQRELLHGPFDGGAVAWSQSANKVCFSDPAGARLYFFDCVSDSLTSELPFGPTSLCVNPMDNKVYFQHLDTTFIVSMASESVVGRVCTRGSWGPAMWNRNNDLVYVVGQEHVYRICGSGDTLLPDLAGSYDGRLCALSWKSNTLYLVSAYGLQAVDCTTGEVLADVPGFYAGRIEYDSTDDRLYGIYDFWEPVVYVLDCSTNALLHEIWLPNCNSWGICWSPQVNKLYCGGNPMMRSVEESGQPTAYSLQPTATILSAYGVKRLAPCAIFDAIGRRVRDPKPGVYFVRAGSCKLSAVSCQKVVITR
jgi:hypothetical protein